MTLSMADGAIALLPPGMDAYAGYVDDSGIGVTFPGIVVAFPDARYLSISVHGNPALCADVEHGAMTDWTGYPVGYCSVADVMAQVAAHGRPKRLWTAHYTETPHICGPGTCAFPGLMFDVDGTQWHSGAYDESLLNDDFFDFEGSDMALAISSDGCTIAGISPSGHLLVFSADPDKGYGVRWQPSQGVSVSDVTDGIGGTPPYTLAP